MIETWDFDKRLMPSCSTSLSIPRVETPSPGRGVPDPRPLDAGPYTFVAADALTMKVREAGRVINVACLVATGVNADGHREILGLDVCSSESHAAWLTFFRGLTARGLSGSAR